MMKSLLPFLLVIALAGCANNQPAAEKQSFLIQVERPGGALAPVAGTLRIGRVAVAPPFDERSFVYRRDDVRYEPDFYNQFAAEPAAMVAEAASGWLRQSGLFRMVQPPGGASRADFRLEASISAFYVDFQGDVPASVLDIRWQIVREGDGSAVLDLDCRQRVGLGERSPAGAARAYREALEQALARLEAAVAGGGFSSGPPTGLGGIPG
jgi:cholesterol transport system auxiliary component